MMKGIIIICSIIFLVGGKFFFNYNEESIIFSPSRIDYPVGNNPWSLTSGDFNNDGKIDIAVANKENDNLTILTGNGDGTFINTNSFDVGDQPLVIISSLLNGDDYPDLITSNFSGGNVSVLLGNGDGTFQTAVNYNSGITTRYVITADFNEDGYNDLAVSNRDNCTISILTGNGDGTFNAATQSSTGQIKPRFLVTGFFNNDTLIDLAFNHAETVELRSDLVGVLPGNGDGTFGNVIVSNIDIISTYRNANSIAAGDFNEDEIPDLIIGVDASGGEESDYISILLGNGDGSFSNAPLLDLGEDGENPLFINSYFFNNDNHQDFLITGSTGSILSVYTGNGDATFNLDGYYSTAKWPRWITINDFNDDFNMDIATVNEGSVTGGTTSIFLGDGEGSFILSPTSAVDTFQSFTGVAEDLNRDGKIDLAVANWGFSNATDGVLSILNGNGDGTFNQSYSYTIGKAAKVVIAEKFNNDDYPDLALVQDRSHNVAVLINNGDGSFQGAVNYPVDLNPLSMASGDFNLDDNIDLVTTNYNGNNFSILFGNGDGTFGARVDYPTSQGLRDVITADINGDQFLDMLVLCSEIAFNINLIAIHFGNGDGSFGSANIFNLPGALAWDIISGDFNKDNKLDLIISDLETNEVNLYTGNGNGIFNSRSLIGIIRDPRAVMPGDYNNDENLDIAVSSATNNNVTLFLGDGNGYFVKQDHSYGTQEAWNLIAADFDMDQDIDLAVTSGIFGGDHITLLKNITTVSDVEEITTTSPSSFLLEQNYPNPFNPSTKIKFTIPIPHSSSPLSKVRTEVGFVSLNVYDVLGNQVATLVNEEKPSGEYEVTFNANNLSSGIYFYNLKIGEFSAVRKMVLLK